MHSDWDRAFIANPAFKDWLIAQLAARPIPANQLLVEYVRERLGSGGPAAQPAQPAPPAEQPMYVNPASMTYSSSTSSNNVAAPTQQAYIDPSVMTLKSTNSRNGRSATRSLSPAVAPAPKASTSAVTSTAWSRVSTEVSQQLGPNFIGKAPRTHTTKLIELLSPFGSLEDPATAVPAASRLVILEALLRRGTTDVWSTLVEHKNGAGMAVIDQWVKDAVTAIAPKATANGKGKEKEIRINAETSLVATLVPLLKVNYCLFIAGKGDLWSYVYIYNALPMPLPFPDLYACPRHEHVADCLCASVDRLSPGCRFRSITSNRPTWEDCSLGSQPTRTSFLLVRLSFLDLPVSALTRFLQRLSNSLRRLRRHGVR